MMLPQRNIHKSTWTSEDAKTNSQIDWILIGYDIRVYAMLSGAHRDPDHCLVVAKVREKLAVSKKQDGSVTYAIISGSQLRWKLGNSIRLESQPGLQQWKT